VFSGVFTQSWDFSPSVQFQWLLQCNLEFAHLGKGLKTSHPTFQVGCSFPSWIPKVSSSPTWEALCVQSSVTRKFTLSIYGLCMKSAWPSQLNGLILCLKITYHPVPLAPNHSGYLSVSKRFVSCWVVWVLSLFCGCCVCSFNLFQLDKHVFKVAQSLCLGKFFIDDSALFWPPV